MLSNRPRRLLDRVHSDLSLRQLSRREGLALAAITLCALLLRAALQHNRVFWGDEIGTLMYLKKTPTYILTHFDVWLSMNYFILTEKWIASLCGAADWRLTLLPLAAAVAIIPLTASLTLKFTASSRAALIAASLAAFNPCLLWWSPVIRAYSLLIAFSLLAINEFFHWHQQHDWRSGVRCAGVVLLLLLTHLTGIYVVAFLIVLLAIEMASAGWTGGRKFFWRARTLWIPLAGVAIVISVAYWRLLPGIVKINREWGTDVPPTSMGYLPQVFVAYMGTSYIAFLSVVLLLAGSWSAVREKRALLLLWVAIFLGPILMSLQGVSVNWASYARYLIFALPLLLILMAEGIDWLARHIRMRGGATIAAWSLTLIIVLGWTPSIYWQQFLVKRQWPYARVAKFLHEHMQKGDVIVAGWAIRFTLGQFFDHPGDEILMPDMYINRVTRLDAPVRGRVFYVTGLGSFNGRKVPIRRFGGIEVTIYSGATPRALLNEWRDDLLNRTAGRVYAPFQGDYELLALLEERLPSGQSTDHWRSLAQRCLAQSPAARNVPRHLEKTTRSVKFP
jgi:uncharacterized membrane protein